jgi:hypothetical protein
MGAEREDGVLIVYADFDPGRLVTLAKAAKDYQSALHRTHTIHNWIDDKKPAKSGVAQRTYAAILGNRVIFAQRQERVAQGLDAVDHISANLASSPIFADLGTGSGMFMQAAARKFDLSNSAPNAAIFRLSKQMGLVVSETQRQISATLTIEANDEEVAGNLHAISSGLISLIKLQKEKPESVRFAEALQLKQDGSKVIVSMSMPVDDAIAGMKADAARKAAKKSAN